MVLFIKNLICKITGFTLVIEEAKSVDKVTLIFIFEVGVYLKTAKIISKSFVINTGSTISRVVKIFATRWMGSVIRWI